MKFKFNFKTAKAGLVAYAKRKPKQAAAAGFATLFVLWLIVHQFTKTDVTQYIFHPVKRGDFVVSIVEGGTIKAVNEVSVRSEMEGLARIISIVPEGTNVNKGDLLVELDSADLRERVNAQDVTYQNTLFNFVQAKENLEIQKSVIESNIKDYELRLEFAKSDLRKYIEGDWPQLKKVTEARITITQEELERAKDRSDWTQQLLKKGYATKSEMEADTLNVKRKEIELSQGQEDLRLLEKFTYPKQVRSYEAAVNTWEKELERLIKRSDSQVAQLEASLKSQKSSLDLQEKRLNELREQMKLTKIYAPQSGLVIYASSSTPGSGVLIEEGAMIRQKQDIIKLPDTTQMMVEIRVHESHVQKVKPGLDAFVTIDSIPDQRFHGTVRKVAVLPDSTSRYFNPNLKVYSTEVLIEDAIPDLKPGISARAEVVITNLYSVLTVPIQAVTTMKGQQVCLVEKGSSAKPVPVEVGMFNDKLIEIKSGVREGDMVMLSALNSSDSIDMSGSIVGADTNNNPRSKGRSNSKLSKIKTDKAGKTNAVAAAAKPGTNSAPVRPEPPKLNPPAATGGSNSVTKS